MIVKQVFFAFQVLEFFAERKNPATLSEIADHFSWPRSSTFNLIETLIKSGLLYEPRYRAGYYPTPRLLRLAREIVEEGPIPDNLRSAVSRLAVQTGETAILAAPSALSAVFLEVVESSAPIRYFAHVGQRVPLHVTSAGRALLSLLSAKERSAVLRKCEYLRYAPESLMTPQSVEADIVQSIERGWFLNNNGYLPDLVGVAVPLPISDRQLCLLVAGPAYRLLDKIEETAALIRAEITLFTGCAEPVV